ncbi:MAG: hypothetical protein DMF78_09310 [Acidobacteria bacterium]|nr:MAG: hypothetical protein DMF78_09310 [Acidobacteriota bacterium]
MTAPRIAHVAVLLLAPALVSAAPALDPRIVKLLDEISPARLEASLKHLESFQTRHTLSSTDTPGRGIGAAREWILAEMKSYSPRLQVSFDTYRIPKQGERITREAELRNVMAVLPGKTPRRFYVSGHYDSVARPVASPRPVSPSPAPQSAGGGFDWTVTDNVAPGVNDDGSGTALTMELARVFAQSGLDFDATLVFICFAGEEEGLVGAKLHAAGGLALALSRARDPPRRRPLLARAPRPLDRALRPLRPRRRPQRLQPARLRGRALHGEQGELRPPAHGP